MSSELEHSSDVESETPFVRAEGERCTRYELSRVEAHRVREYELEEVPSGLEFDTEGPGVVLLPNPFLTDVPLTENAHVL